MRIYAALNNNLKFLMYYTQKEHLLKIKLVDRTISIFLKFSLP
jgi:hypothetical protein